jgi:hypothetical protein
VNLMICAEAMFLDQNEQGKARKVGDRAATWASAQAGTHARTAYGVRNSVVHSDPTWLEQLAGGRGKVPLHAFNTTIDGLLRDALLK